MHPVVRSSLAVIAGVIVAVLLIGLIEEGAHAIWPFPDHAVRSHPEHARELLENIPIGALLFVFAAWTCGAFGGAAVAALIARRRAMFHAGLVGAVVLAAALANLAMLPHPVWFALLGVAGICVGTFAAGTLVSARTAPQ
jgi:hypothetical protein